MAVSTSWFQQWGTPSHIHDIFANEPISQLKYPPRTTIYHGEFRNFGLFDLVARILHIIADK